MKTLLSRAKTLVKNNNGAGQTLEYVKHVEIVHPQIDLTAIFVPSLPKILLTPDESSEKWVASGRKQITHFITAYLVILYHQRETSIIGDEARGLNGKGITDFVNDFDTVFRGHRFAVNDQNYLDKPLDIVGIQYADPIELENGHLLAASVRMECSRLITQTTLPTNI